MTQPTLNIQFSEEIRGKNAANFWTGIGIIVAVAYAWWHNWFSFAMFETGVLERSGDEGFASGAIDMAIDTVCLLGLAGMTAFKYCRKFLSALLERGGFVSAGVLSWASREQAAVQPTIPEVEDKVVAQLRANYERINSLEDWIKTLDSIVAKLNQPKAGNDV